MSGADIVKASRFVFDRLLPSRSTANVIHLGKCLIQRIPTIIDLTGDFELGASCKYKVARVRWSIYMGQSISMTTHVVAYYFFTCRWNMNWYSCENKIQHGQHFDSHESSSKTFPPSLVTFQISMFSMRAESSLSDLSLHKQKIPPGDNSPTYLSCCINTDL